MSSESTPIPPARFAAALKDLSLASLHLKVLELRNSIAHLDYSNEQLRPFADGKEVALDGTAPQGPGRPGEPDQDCIDAIAENEAVIARMEERIGLVRAEVEGRGVSWSEFRSKEEVDAEEAGPRVATNGDTGQLSTPATSHWGETGRTDQAHEAWRDGTFQTGTIHSNGTVHLNGESRPVGGTITDDELHRRVEEQMGELGEDEEDGMHL